MIGLFGLGEILLTMEEGLAFKGDTARINPKVVFQIWTELPKFWVTSLRIIIVGCWMGITPGGATPASFMSYGLAKRFSRTGEIRDRRDGGRGGAGDGGACRRDQRAPADADARHPGLADGGRPARRPLIWGLQPGPLLFVEQKDFVWGLIASIYIANIAGLIVVLTTVPLFASILRIPFSVIAPVIIVICAVGAYTVNNAFFDIIFMLIFGVIGYVFKKLDYPLAPMVLALVLGDMAESSFRQSMLLSDGSLSIFWSNPLVASIMGLAMLMLFWPLISRVPGDDQPAGEAARADGPAQ